MENENLFGSDSEFAKSLRKALLDAHLIDESGNFIRQDGTYIYDIRKIKTAIKFVEFCKKHVIDVGCGESIAVDVDDIFGNLNVRMKLCDIDMWSDEVKMLSEFVDDIHSFSISWNRDEFLDAIVTFRIKIKIDSEV